MADPVEPTEHECEAPGLAGRKTPWVAGQRWICGCGARWTADNDGELQKG